VKGKTTKGAERFVAAKGDFEVDPPGKKAEPAGAKMKGAEEMADSSKGDAEEQAELIAYQSMRDVLDGAEGQFEKISGLVDELIADETESPAETPEDEAAEEQVETARLDAIRTLCQSLSAALNAVISATYCQSLSDGAAPGRYMATAAGARHSAADMKAIQGVHDHAMALGAACDRGNYKAAEEKKSDKPEARAAGAADGNRHYIETVRRSAAGAK